MYVVTFRFRRPVVEVRRAQQGEPNANDAHDEEAAHRHHKLCDDDGLERASSDVVVDNADEEDEAPNDNEACKGDGRVAVVHVPARAEEVE